VLISLGGWTWSEDFSDAALTAQSRAQTAASCIDVYLRGNLPVADGAGGPGAAFGVFDGIDIDWEYPAAPGHPHNTYRPEDTQNFTLFLQEFRNQMNALEAQTGREYLLTIAAPAGVDKYEKIQLNQIHQYLDWINIMTYDMHGGWDTTTNFHAPLYNSPNDPSSYPANTYSVNTAVQAYRTAGVPANKLIIGVPFYGRGWTGVTNTNNGLYRPVTGPAPGTYEAGNEDYKVLKNLNYPLYRDPITGAMWVFNGSIFWSYDDPVVIGTKMSYIINNSLRGAMVWSLDGDDASGTLMNAVGSGLP
jgi:chitinase